MTEYRVKIRGTVDLGQVGDLKNLDVAGWLSPTLVTANSANDAAAIAISEVAGSDHVEAELVYVFDAAGGAEVFWPPAEPLEYIREEAPRAQTACFLRLPDFCRGLVTTGDADVFVVEGGWVCDACAAIVAPNL